MRESTDRVDARNAARDLFAAFLERHYEGCGDFEGLCRAHPEHATYFRERHAFLAMAGELDEPLAPSQDEAPTVIGGFRIEGELGRGGMGVVYEAFDPQLGRHVALKVLPQARRLFGDTRQRFEREIAAMGRLSHPNIVTIFRAGLDDDPPHLVMELVRGRSLATFVERSSDTPPGDRTLEDSSPDPETRGDDPETRAEEETATSRQDRTYFRRVARWIAEVADALEHAHQRGVLHRDVKPGNILIDERCTARLVDFGVARVVGEASLTVTGGFAGTPGYAAPEQVSTSQGTIDARADVYSLGVVLYELLTGHVPFRAEETAQLFQRILHEVPRDPHRVERGVPIDLSVICSKALEKSRDRRYPSAAAMAADLRAWLRDRPIVARPPSLGRRLRRTVQRHALATTILLGLLVAGFSWALSANLSKASVWAGELSRAEEETERVLQDIQRLDQDLEALARLDRERRDLLVDWNEVNPTAEDRERRGRLEVAVRAGRREMAQRREDLEGRIRDVGMRLGQDAYERLELSLRMALLRYARALDDTVWTEDVMRSLERHRDVPEVRDALEDRRFVGATFDGEVAVMLFRYRDEVEILDRFRHPRVLPQPCTLAGDLLPFPEIAGWQPGEACFQVEHVDANSLAANLGIQPGDLVFRAQGVEGLERAHEERRAVTVWRAGTTFHLELPVGAEPGWNGYATQYPLFGDPAHGRVGREFRLHLPQGSYLLLARANGLCDARVPFALRDDELSYSVPLHASSSVPRGFAYVPPGWFEGGGDAGRSYEALPGGLYPIAGFFMARHEVTFGEYLSVLGWADAHWPGSVSSMIPEDSHTDASWPWTIDPITFAIEPAWMAELPVFGVSQRAALQYANLLTRIGQERGEPWIYELPWGMSWEKAARGGDGRIFPWGDAFDWALCAGFQSVPRQDGLVFPLPFAPMQATFLGDESPYSIQGLCGNVEEFVYRVDRRNPIETPGVKGGGVLRRDAMSYRLPRYLTQNARPSVGTGFRLVARLPGMPVQGPDGHPMRGPWPTRAHD
ncbi:MAG: protein kinase [Planctomycetes bacterium]|nr:protein kinase [Planctomycetota bacterium]MCB9891810.1 protein kinase [Planctomycetota bacterium]